MIDRQLPFVAFQNITVLDIFNRLVAQDLNKIIKIQLFLCLPVDGVALDLGAGAALVGDVYVTLWTQRRKTGNPLVGLQFIGQVAHLVSGRWEVLAWLPAEDDRISVTVQELLS